jgi:hypothetical protein
MNAFHRLAQLFDGAITSTSANWQVVIGIAAIILVIGAPLLWWWVPKWQMRSVTTGDPKARADIEDNFRKTVGQALGGIAVLIGAGVAYLQFLQQQQAARDLLISQQVSKGFEDLGNKDAIMVRLGGIYLLAGVMKGSDQYHQPVLEALCSFVRENTKTYDGDDPPATDIHAALSVIAHEKGMANLDSVRIPRANLSFADLSLSDVGGTFLANANLRWASLFHANLSGAVLIGANLTSANLIHADLRGAVLFGANLTRADLAGADLSLAFLFGANLSGANLSGAHNYEFSPGKGISPPAKISQAQLDEACGVDAELPPGLTLKPCPPPK